MSPRGSVTGLTVAVAGFAATFAAIIAEEQLADGRASWILVSGRPAPTPEAGSPKPEAESQEPEAWSLEPEA